MNPLLQQSHPLIRMSKKLLLTCALLRTQFHPVMIFQLTARPLMALLLSSTVSALDVLMLSQICFCTTILAATTKFDGPPTLLRPDDLIMTVTILWILFFRIYYLCSSCSLSTDGFVPLNTWGMIAAIQIPKSSPLLPLDVSVYF
jgi:hypothetical protein